MSLVSKLLVQNFVMLVNNTYFCNNNIEWIGFTHTLSHPNSIDLLIDSECSSSHKLVIILLVRSCYCSGAGALFLLFAFVVLSNVLGTGGTEPPTSRTLLSHFPYLYLPPPAFSALLPSRDLRSPARLTFFAILELTRTCALMSTFYDL